MNEFERRRLELAQNDLDLHKVARSFGTDALIEHFGYTLSLGSIASPLVNGVTQQGVIQIQSDAYFVVMYVSCCVIRPDNPQVMQPASNVKLQITDTGAGETLYSTPSLGGILAGTPTRGQTGIPMLLPIPRILLPNTNVKIEATQVGVNGTDNQQPVGFFVSLMGSRVAQVGG